MAVDVLISRELKLLQDELSAAQRERLAVPAALPAMPPSSVVNESADERELRDQLGCRDIDRPAVRNTLRSWTIRHDRRGFRSRQSLAIRAPHRAWGARNLCATRSRPIGVLYFSSWHKGESLGTATNFDS
jgi:hypothetical protein